MGIIGDVHVKVSTEALSAKAQTVSKSITAMERCFEDIENIISRTGYYWLGEAGDQHRKMYQEQKENIDEMMRRLKEHPADLLIISQNYSITENAVREEADRLPGDVIE